MKINLQDLKKPVIDTTITRNITHGDLQLELQVKDDQAFKSALAKVAPLLDAKPLGKNDLKRTAQTDLSTHEMLLFVIGEYCIANWNVTDTEDNPIEIAGDNFLLLLNALPDLPDFLSMLLETFGEMMSQLGKSDELKKKPKSTIKR